MQYDQDVVTWSPQGRIHQIEYAMEAVKQGSAAVGLKVTIDLFAPPRQLTSVNQSSHTYKLVTLDDHRNLAQPCEQWYVDAEQNTCCLSYLETVA